MSAVLTLATSDHLGTLLALAQAFHVETGVDVSDDTRRNAFDQLLRGVPHGAAYLIGPTRAPIGYVVLSFGWSIEFGGLDAFIDEVYVRPGVRGRGIGTEVLEALPRALVGAGLKALHLEVSQTDEGLIGFYTGLGFVRREGFAMLSRRF